MPVEAQTVEYSYLGDGVSTVFEFPSRFLSNADLFVALNGVLQVAGFVTTGAGTDNGGEVTFTVPPGNLVRVMIVRNPSPSQLIDFENGQTVLEGTLDNAFDKLTMIAQYLSRVSDRTIKLSEFDTTVPAGYLDLPEAALRLGKFIGFDGDGKLTAVDFVNAGALAVQSSAESELVAYSANGLLLKRTGVTALNGSVSAIALSLATPLAAVSGGTGDSGDRLNMIEANISGLSSIPANGIKWLPAVDAATTNNRALSGEQTIDGVATSASRLLVKNQTTASENGLYTTSAGAWTRTADTLLYGGVNVKAGTTQAGSSWTSPAANQWVQVATFDNTAITLKGGTNRFDGGVLIENRTASISAPTLAGSVKLYMRDDELRGIPVSGALPMPFVFKTSFSGNATIDTSHNVERIFNRHDGSGVLTISDGVYDFGTTQLNPVNERKLRLVGATALGATIKARWNLTLGGVWFQKLILQAMTGSSLISAEEAFVRFDNCLLDLSAAAVSVPISISGGALHMTANTDDCTVNVGAGVTSAVFDCDNGCGVKIAGNTTSKRVKVNLHASTPVGLQAFVIDNARAFFAGLYVTGVGRRGRGVEARRLTDITFSDENRMAGLNRGVSARQAGRIVASGVDMSDCDYGAYKEELGRVISSPSTTFGTYGANGVNVFNDTSAGWADL